MKKIFIHYKLVVAILLITILLLNYQTLFQTKKTDDLIYVQNSQDSAEKIDDEIKKELEKVMEEIGGDKNGSDTYSEPSSDKLDEIMETVKDIEQKREEKLARDVLNGGKTVSNPCNNSCW